MATRLPIPNRSRDRAHGHVIAVPADRRHERDYERWGRDGIALRRLAGSLAADQAHLVALIGVLIAFHIVTPSSRALSIALFLVSLAAVWLGVELSH